MANGQLIIKVRLRASMFFRRTTNIADQRSLEDRCVAIVALPHNKRRPIVARASDIANPIKTAKPGQNIVMQLDGSRRVKSIVNGEEILDDLPPLTPFASDLTSLHNT